MAYKSQRQLDQGVVFIKSQISHEGQFNGLLPVKRLQSCRRAHEKWCYKGVMWDLRTPQPRQLEKKETEKGVGFNNLHLEADCFK